MSLGSVKMVGLYLVTCTITSLNQNNGNQSDNPQRARRDDG